MTITCVNSRRRAARLPAGSRPELLMSPPQSGGADEISVSQGNFSRAKFGRGCTRMHFARQCRNQKEFTTEPRRHGEKQSQNAKREYTEMAEATEAPCLDRPLTLVAARKRQCRLDVARKSLQRATISGISKCG